MAAKAPRSAAGPAVEPATGFPGIGPGAIRFFEGIAANNDRAWFLAHKADYEADVLAPLRALVAAVSNRLQAAGVPLVGDPLRAVFRINRDVRFSGDKRPYRTESGAVLSRDGEKSGSGVLHILVGARGGFSACGFYHPGPTELHALRTAVAARPETFAAAMDGIELAADDTLTRMPRGFESYVDEPFASVLRLKSIVAVAPLSTRQLAGPDAVDVIAGHAIACRRLLDFGWSAVLGAT